MAEPAVYTTTLLEKNHLTSDMLELRFEKPDGFTFKPGQFIQAHVPDHLAQVVLRSYSLASQPSDTYLALCVKIVPGGKASAFFSNLAKGQAVNFRGPEGRFVVAPEHSPIKIFVATGAGIAPIISMLEDEVSKQPNERLHLLFGLRYEHDIFWLDRFERLAAASSSFSYELTLSQPSEAWMGKRGRVTDHLAGLPKTGNWYLCGSLPMVKDVRTILVRDGVGMKQIHFEIF